MPTDRELLESYAQKRSEAAFTELVTRHINVVYSAALRETRGDAALAQDIAQAVFLELARKASKLSRHPALAGWLYTCVRNVAANIRRADDRRQRRELEAHTMNELHSAGSAGADWRQVQPVLDDAMHELNETDRAAVVLRYFEDRSHKEVGLALGLAENAARMRIERALERLRALLAKRGIKSTASGLAAALAVGAATSAPSGLAAGVTATALAGASAGGGTTLTILKLMSMTKLKTSAVTAVIAAGALSSAVVEYNSQAKLGPADAALQRQREQLAAQTTDNERLSNAIARIQRAPANSQAELLSLRDEAAKLREGAAELAKLQEENRQLKTNMQQARRRVIDDLHGPEAQQTERGPLLNTRLDYCMRMGGALSTYAREHEGQYPTNAEQLAGVMTSLYGSMTNFAGIRPNEFEIVYQGPPPPEDKYAHPGDIIRIREKLPWQNTDGKWVKVYAMVSGQGMTHVQTDPNFDAWERRRIVPSGTEQK